MNRRTLVQSLLGLPLFSWMATKEAASSTTYAPPGACVANQTGLEARRKEAIDLFTLAFDNCVKAEQEFIPGSQPTGIDIKVLVQYPDRKTQSNPSLQWDGPLDRMRATKCGASNPLRS